MATFTAYSAGVAPKQYGQDLTSPKKAIKSTGFWGSAGYNGQAFAAPQTAAPAAAPAAGIDLAALQKLFAPQQMPQINTTITPTDIYSPQQSQRALNSQRADQLTQSDLPWMLNNRQGAGNSASGIALSDALPAISKGLSASAYMGGAIPFADATANATQNLSGQIAREGEYNQLGNLYLTQAQQRQSALMNLLGMFLQGSNGLTG